MQTLSVQTNGHTFFFIALMRAWSSARSRSASSSSAARDASASPMASRASASALSLTSVVDSELKGGGRGEGVVGVSNQAW